MLFVPARIKPVKKGGVLFELVQIPMGVRRKPCATIWDSIVRYKTERGVLDKSKISRGGSLYLILVQKEENEARTPFVCEIRFVKFVFYYEFHKTISERILFHCGQVENIVFQYLTFRDCRDRKSRPTEN
jgi:hypothetical protein